MKATHPEPECPTCTAVARGGRIRLTEDGAELVERLLREARSGVLVVRRSAIDGNMPGVASIANVELRLMDVLLEEIERTQQEKGWHTSHGEPERPES